MSTKDKILYFVERHTYFILQKQLTSVQTVFVGFHKVRYLDFIMNFLGAKIPKACVCIKIQYVLKQCSAGS